MGKVKSEACEEGSRAKEGITSEVQRPKRRLSRQEALNGENKDIPDGRVYLTRNTIFVLSLKFLQGPKLEAALVFLQRKEVYLSQTESSEIFFL